jgi:hypothetical protein
MKKIILTLVVLFAFTAFGQFRDDGLNKPDVK